MRQTSHLAAGRVGSQRGNQSGKDFFCSLTSDADYNLLRLWFLLLYECLGIRLGIKQHYLLVDVFIVPKVLRR
jgi:hypothetical protein